MVGKTRHEAQRVGFAAQADSDSVISRYIQPADPVYQLQPPRPVCGAKA